MHVTLYDPLSDPLSVPAFSFHGYEVNTVSPSVARGGPYASPYDSRLVFLTKLGPLEESPDSCTHERPVRVLDDRYGRDLVEPRCRRRGTPRIYPRERTLAFRNERCFRTFYTDRKARKQREPAARQYRARSHSSEIK